MPPRERQHRRQESSDDDTATTDVPCEFVHLRKQHVVRRAQSSLPITTTLPILMGLDMLGVSLVVPLLNQYYLDAGIHNPYTREWLSLLFSTSQIVGGILLSYLTDALHVSKKRVLQLTFLGSCISYGLIQFGTLHALMLSRVTVGCVKHSLTISISLISQYTSVEHRGQHVGNLTAASSISWIVGPSIGALMYKHIHNYAPPALACGLFGLNLTLATVLLPNEDNESSSQSNCEEFKESNSVASKLRTCFISKTLASVVVVKLLIIWVQKATNYNLFPFYEEMYGIESHQRGYISSYQQLLQFIVASLLVKRLLKTLGGERRTAVLCCVLMAVTVALETQRSLTLFLSVICPLSSLSIAMIQLCLQTLVTQVAPKGTVFSVVAALDILQNVVSVTVPFYRTKLIDWTTSSSEDPDPVSWALFSSAHWAVLAFVSAYCLITSWPDQVTSPAKKNQ